MKYLRVILFGVSVVALAGCASSNDSKRDQNVSVNQPYSPDVGATNNIAEPAGTGTSPSNR